MGGRAARLAACSLAMLAWSASFVGTRIAYTALTPLWLAFARFFLASMVLVPIVCLGGKSWPKGRSLGIVALSGIVGITLYYAAENWGVRLTSASNASLVTASFPAFPAG